MIWNNICKELIWNNFLQKKWSRTTIWSAWGNHMIHGISNLKIDFRSSCLCNLDIESLSLNQMLYGIHRYPKFQMGDLSLLDAVESEVFSLSSADSWLTWCWYKSFLMLMSILLLWHADADTNADNCFCLRLVHMFPCIELINFTHHDNSSCPRLEWSFPLCLVWSTTLLKRSLLENN